MSKLKLLALFAVLAGGAVVVYRRLTAGDDVWQSVTDPVDPGQFDAPARPAPAPAPATPSEAPSGAPAADGEEADIERGVGEGLPPEDPFEGHGGDPLTDPLPDPADKEE